MRILLTNDDGWQAAGIIAMHQALLKAGHSVCRVAPDGERSANSHAITIKEALRVRRRREEETEVFSVSGTPADCVKIGLHALCPEAEFVISGINYGYNAGVDVLYSGTVAAAREGLLSGVPSMAVSRDHAIGDPYAEDAAACAVVALEHLIRQPMPQGTLVNFNYPARPLSQCLGIREAALSNTFVKDCYVRCVENRWGEDWYVMDLENYIETNPVPGCDRAFLREGYATVTYLGWDTTQLAGHWWPEDLLK